jgi:hypothetical protein
VTAVARTVHAAAERGDAFAAITVFGSCLASTAKVGEPRRDGEPRLAAATAGAG